MNTDDKDEKSYLEVLGKVAIFISYIRYSNWRGGFGLEDRKLLSWIFNVIFDGDYNVKILTMMDPNDKDFIFFENFLLNKSKVVIIVDTLSKGLEKFEAKRYDKKTKILFPVKISEGCRIPEDIFVFYDWRKKTGETNLECMDRIIEFLELVIQKTM